MLFHWSLSDSNSIQVSRTLLNILIDHENTVVWMISILFLISNPSSPFSEPLGIVPSTQTTTGITVSGKVYVTFAIASMCLTVQNFRIIIISIKLKFVFIENDCRDHFK